jgi:hypothetical protein
MFRHAAEERLDVSTRSCLDHDNLEIACENK